MKQLLPIAVVLMTALPVSAWAVDATVVDSADQTMELRKVQTSEKPSREFLAVATETWNYDIHFTLIKEAKPDPGKKRKESYGPIPFVVTLTTGKTINGGFGGNLTGESDFGKAEVRHDRIKSIAFRRAKGEDEFKPSGEEPSASVTDRGGAAVPLTSVKFHAGNRNQAATEIIGTRGAVELRIPVEDVEKIEYLGEVKGEYRSETKVMVTLSSGKSTELVLSGLSIEGECAFGLATLEISKLQSAVLSGKRGKRSGSLDRPHPARRAASVAARKGMVEVPGASLCTPGYNPSLPGCQVRLPSFWMDQTEVTTSMYAEFVKATGYVLPEPWTSGWYPPGQESCPVTGVSFVDAMFYCAWRGVRLPSKEEWALAAYGNGGRRYPWGDQADPEAFAKAVPMRPVGSFPKSAGPHGLYDIVGNVWEWSCSPLRRELDSAIVQDSAFLFGGGTLSLNECLFYGPKQDQESDGFGGFSLAGPIMMFWDEREGLPGTGTGKMWGAWITSRSFSYVSAGSGTIIFGSGSFSKSYPEVCAVLADLSARCESIGFRCAAD